MTLAELRTVLYDRLSFTSTPATEVARRLDSYLNDGQRILIPKRGLSRLRRSVLTFSSVANSPFVVMPQALVRIVAIQDRVVNRVLAEISLQDLRFRDPGLRAITSNPEAYSILHLASPVSLQPSTADVLYVKSDSASDTGVAYIQGITSGGYPRIAQVTMTGTTAVSFTPTDWIEITKFYLSTAAVGTVTLLQTTSSGTELSRISIGRTLARFTRLHLWGTPSAVNLYYVDGEIHVEDMVNAGDSPYMPEDFHIMLVARAQMLEAHKRQDWPGRDRYQREWEDWVSELIEFCRRTTDTGRSSGAIASQFSQLGPWYRAGT